MSSASMPGIRRIRSGRGFRYSTPDGTVVRDAATLARIRSLAIPPAWEDVWICPLASGHLQATGRDAKGRKQHRYHPLYRAVRDQVKYERMIAFGRALKEIRNTVAADLARPGLPREKVLAAVVRLLETTLIRVGNDEYARHNDSYGLTTMLGGHAEIHGATVRFHFRGKSGRNHEISVSDGRVAKIVRRCQELPGEHLFEYLDSHGRILDVTSGDVNDYLRGITGHHFTAKDFRTWNGTVLAAMALGGLDAPASANAAHKNVVTVVKEVAEKLGNRPAACRKYYLHPAVLEAYTAGELIARLGSQPVESRSDLSRVESRVLRILQRRRTFSPARGA